VSLSDSPASEEDRTWRRRFASRANNRAWTLSEQASRTPQEDLEMLDAAHASMHLWRSIGDARNSALADLLLGQVHALLGSARFALPYAAAAHSYFTSNPSEPRDVAISHAVLDNAAYCAGNSALYETSYRAAAALIESLPDGDEKAILEATMNVVPKPEKAC
jgi:hypothetical protein